MTQKKMTRREFLKNAGIAGAGLIAAGLAGCATPTPAVVKETVVVPGTPQVVEKVVEKVVTVVPPTPVPATATPIPKPTKTANLKLQLISHFVAGYDDWIKQFATDWGKANGVNVSVSFVSNVDLAARGAAEVAAQKGHDIVQWDQAVSSPFLWKNHAVDLTDVVKEIEGKYGKFSAVAQQAGFDSTTNTWFSLPIFYMAFPSLYRKDLWDQVGGFPDTWEKVLEGGRKLKAMGNPLGLPISRGSDANVNWRGVIWSFGGAVQDKDQKIVLNSPEVIEAVKFARALYKETMTEEVLAWDDTGNNRFLTSGKGSLIFNPISAYISIRGTDKALADKIFVAKPPQGPKARLMGVTPHSWTLWKFGENQVNAIEFMKYFVTNFKSSFEKSGGYNMPMNPGWVPTPMPLLANDPANNPPDKLAIVQTAPEWSVGFEYPGPNSPAMGEVIATFVIPDMIAQAATDRMTPEDAVKWATDQVNRIVRKWST
jgi:multiple sugar transport system substrate-binding protein